MGDAQPHETVGARLRRVAKRFRGDALWGTFFFGLTALSGVGIPVALAYGAGMAASLAAVDLAGPPLGRVLLRTRLAIARNHPPKRGPEQGNGEKRWQSLSLVGMGTMWAGIGLTFTGVLAPVGFTLLGVGLALGLGSTAYHNASKQYVAKATPAAGTRWTPPSQSLGSHHDRSLQVTGRSMGRSTPSLTVPPVTREQPSRQVDV